jgi:hypothetical protein
MVWILTIILASFLLAWGSDFLLYRWSGEPYFPIPMGPAIVSIAAGAISHFSSAWAAVPVLLVYVAYQWKAAREYRAYDQSRAKELQPKA